MRMIVAFFFIIPGSVVSQVTLDPIFSDHMMFQRDKPIALYGKGMPGSTVRVILDGQQRETMVNGDSSWIVRCGPRPYSEVPFSIRIASQKDTFQLNDLLAGDVWLCIGQSNMEWPMYKEMYYDDASASCGQSALRFYNPVYAGKEIYGALYADAVVGRLRTELFYNGQWQVSDSNSFRRMSAVAYYFGKQLLDSANIPIGLINYSIGGAPLETFIDRSVLAQHPQFSLKVVGDWLQNDALPVWVRERGRQNVGSADLSTGEKGMNHPFQPGFAYDRAIKNLHLFPIKGIICYQGESNAQEMERVMEYVDLSICMVNDYRKKWEDPGLPFYFVQLSSIDTVKYKGHLWALFRNEQRKLHERLPYSGMAVSSDHGHPYDVHPRNKKEIGGRLARWALRDLYGKSIVPSGPLPGIATYRNGKIVMRFRYAESGLRTSDGGIPKGFSLDGFSEIVARIRDSRIEIGSPKKPEYDFYGWKPFSSGNLENAEGLPASTFKIPVQ